MAYSQSPYDRPPQHGYICRSWSTMPYILSERFLIRVSFRPVSARSRNLTRCITAKIQRHGVFGCWRLLLIQLGCTLEMIRVKIVQTHPMKNTQLCVAAFVVVAR
jgi:hypothetical protein